MSGDQDPAPATCPICGQLIPVNRNTGRLRLHPDYPRRIFCPGSGTTPP